MCQDPGFVPYAERQISPASSPQPVRQDSPDPFTVPVGTFITYSCIAGYTGGAHITCRRTALPSITCRPNGKNFRILIPKLEFFLNGAELSLNSGNLMNH